MRVRHRIRFAARDFLRRRFLKSTNAACPTASTSPRSRSWWSWRRIIFAAVWTDLDGSTTIPRLSAVGEGPTPVPRGQPAGVQFRRKACFRPRGGHRWKTSNRRRPACGERCAGLNPGRRILTSRWSFGKCGRRCGGLCGTTSALPEPPRGSKRPKSNRLSAKEIHANIIGISFDADRLNCATSRWWPIWSFAGIGGRNLGFALPTADWPGPTRPWGGHFRGREPRVFVERPGDRQPWLIRRRPV